jgi:hypothetical protein
VPRASRTIQRQRGHCLAQISTALYIDGREPQGGDVLHREPQTQRPRGGGVLGDTGRGYVPRQVLQAARPLRGITQLLSPAARLQRDLPGGSYGFDS